MEISEPPIFPKRVAVLDMEEEEEGAFGLHDNLHV